MVKKELSQTLKMEGGYEALKGYLNSIPQSPAALAFLAMIIKENGALHVSLKLYKEAAQLMPSSASYSLNLVHIHELLNQYNDAFLEIKRYCRENPNLSVGQLTCGHVYNAIKGFSGVISEEDPNTPTLPTIETDPIPLTASYSPDQLDILALFCTLVKVLYVAGNLSLIPRLSAIINPVREKRPMHTTTIRNEHAYYCCIDQLMVYHSNLPDKTLPYIYLAGDSHALTTAWQTINFKGSPHVIKPLLVTGLKCWHLRPESTFYPKENFWNVVPTAPPGSHIIFQFGEIDCREGFVFAVQKGIYEDIAEGASVAIDIYIDVLLQLQKQYNFHIYIHPPSPVIDVTREIVRTFTRILKQKVQETGTLHYLDFADELLTPNKANLNPKFDLDGTHMNPSYLYLLENSLNLLPNTQQ
uniref:Uncharacterized protein n=1 Tax=Arcella intermedia TaxID=1963864 RepID=A0A6B2L5B5_9EUKA